jgi:hypothetical protein
MKATCKSIHLIYAGSLFLLVTASPTLGALSLTSATYTQNFDTLATGPSTGNVFTNDVTIPGWYWQTDYQSNDTLYTGDDGGANGDVKYSYGTDASSDRAMGHFADFVNVADPRDAAWGIVFQNNTGAPINTVTVDYFGEQWRHEPTTADALRFSFRTSATNITDFVPNSGATPAMWTAVSGLDFLAPQIGAGGATALDGNLAANRTQRTHTFSVTVPVGEYLALRWYDASVANSGNQQGMGIDDLNVTVAVPEPAAFLFGGMVCGVIGVVWVGRHLVGKQVPSANSQGIDAATKMMQHATTRHFCCVCGGKTLEGQFD